MRQPDFSPMRDVFLDRALKAASAAMPTSNPRAPRGFQNSSSHLDYETLILRQVSGQLSH
jgi:hypothetical protein